MKKFFKTLGWIFLGIFLQFKFNVLYGIVFLENLNFHDRTYFIEMSMPEEKGNLHVLHIKTVVHHSLGPDYFAHVYLPDQLKVLNKETYKGAESIPGYQAYQMSMKRKYRDVLSAEDFIIAPLESGKDIPLQPIFVNFENLKQRLHSDDTYKISLSNQTAKLEGPKKVEALYPQQWSM
ncbi:MAG: hypothetical protein G3M78_09455 [Candidatus Nitrohelix vancouverensis]|uniref:Uncharacterized protein n=1 Tax=Candidatus Nitrohelix vancouverensis TaxID=2705534 RepID=A0A7T0C330_9BACT|nr:MAG: hypothetical protein G3M78_09455 [Candidatus Nitrohelix vancouverensis]